MHVRYALTFGRGVHRHQLLQRARQLGVRATEMPDMLFISDQQTPSMRDNVSLLVGQLFSAENSRLHALPAALSKPTNLTDQAKADGLWGNFVFFFSSNGRPGVYRDPSAGVPIYRCGSGPEAIFVSDAQFASELGYLQHATPNFDFAVHWLQFPFLRSNRTCVRNVTEVLPGTLHSLDDHGRWTERPIWRPADFVKRGQAIFDADEAATRLREVALAVIPAQIGFGSVVLQLSGGLDSSIVAACLASAGQSIECVNFATRSPDGDERDFARLVAEFCDLPLHELQEPETASLSPPWHRTFRPATNPLLLPFDVAINNAGKELKADILVDGAGGDNLFCYLTSASPVLDALRWGGLFQSFETVGDIAMRANCTWWEVVRAAIGAARPGASWKEDRSFLRRAILLERADPHPWLEGLAEVPPGKREHVQAMVHIQHFLDRRSAGTSLSHPLMAQPLLELCLRLPSWLWMRGGRNRAIARDAFRGILPPPVLARRSKGSLQSLLYRSFGQQRGEILDLLMSGTLRAEGILDAFWLESVLRSENWRCDDVQLRVSEITALELWLEAW